MIKPTSLSSQTLFSTAQIVTHNSDGSDSKGTAFFFHFKVDEQRSVPVLITNKHVIEGSVLGTFYAHESVLDANNQSTPASTSFPVVLPNFEQLWTGHPGDIDLCAMPFEPLRQQAAAAGKNIFYIPFEENLLPSQAQLENLAAMEEVIMVGYPIGLWDSVNNLPLLRRGITASHPAADFSGKPWGLIDIAAFPGSSGSPVLILNQGSYTIPTGIAIGSRLIFLGVLFAGPQHQADGSIQIVDIPTRQVPIARTSLPAHLGYYIKAREILELKKHLFQALQIQ